MKKINITAEQRKKIGKFAKIAATITSIAATIASGIMLGKAMKDGDAKKINGFGALTITSSTLFASTLK